MFRYGETEQRLVLGFQQGRSESRNAYTNSLLIAKHYCCLENRFIARHHEEHEHKC